MRTIITGAGGGIGAAIAEALAAQPDARLVLADRDPERGARNAAHLQALGAAVEVVGGDISEVDTARALVDTCVARFGGIDGLVVAAGSIANDGPMATISQERWEAGFRINTLPLFLLAQAAYPALVESKGAIVALTSSGAKSPAPGLGSYSASKAALAMLVKQLALEWGPDGIRVNCVAPGPTATAMAPAYANPEVRARRTSTIPLRRISEPAEVAAAVLFLLGPGACGITGVDLDVDGGIAISTMDLSGSSLGRMKV